MQIILQFDDEVIEALKQEPQQTLVVKLEKQGAEPGAGSFTNQLRSPWACPPGQIQVKKQDVQKIEITD